MFYTQLSELMLLFFKFLRDYEANISLCKNSYLEMLSF